MSRSRNPDNYPQAIKDLFEIIACLEGSTPFTLPLGNKSDAITLRHTYHSYVRALEIYCERVLDKHNTAGPMREKLMNARRFSCRLLDDNSLEWVDRNSTHLASRLTQMLQQRAELAGVQFDEFGKPVSQNSGNNVQLSPDFNELDALLPEISKAEGKPSMLELIGLRPPQTGAAIAPLVNSSKSLEELEAEQAQFDKLRILRDKLEAATGMSTPPDVDLSDLE